MSWLDGVRRWFGAKSEGTRVYILDAAALHGSARSGERLSPRDQVQVLQQLSRFAEREKIRVQAVFEGRPLREVGQGEHFGPVQVFFVEKSAEISERVLELVRRAGARSAVVVAAQPELEQQVAALGGSSIRPGTFRKALENGGGGEGRSSPRRRRRPRGGGGGRAERPEAGGGSGPAAAPGADGPPPVKDAVRDLIDLVE